MKLSVAVLLLLLQQQPVNGFLPQLQPAINIARRQATLGMGVDTTADVSVPYDAAARLAYDQWRAEFKKGDFDADRFRIFKDNYEIVTIANVKAKKKARDEGTVSLSLMSLNEYGDMTQEEFMGAQQQRDPSIGAPTQPTKTSDILGKAVEAAELQAEASNALEEAFDALAVEEQKLVEALGLESVDELEEALDALEGIAPDGGELETSTLAREARIRDAYLNWCKEFKKEPDETRFPAFSQNFLFMEQYTKTTGKEMALNMYADYSKDEYEAAVKGKQSTPPKDEKLKDPAPPKTAPEKVAKPVELKTPEVAKPKTPPPVPEKTTTTASSPPPAIPKPTPPKSASVPASSSTAPDSGPVLSTEDVLSVAKGVTAGLGGVFGKAAEFAKNANANIKKTIDDGLKEIEDSAETPEARQQRLERLATEQKEIAMAAAIARTEKAKAVQEKLKIEQEKRQQIEKERSERLKQSEKEAAKAQASAEADAIASAKAEAERQAAIAAQRASIEAQAAEQARKKAKEFEEMQKRRQAPPPSTPPKRSAATKSVFANMLSQVQAEPPKPPAPKKAPIKKPPVKKPVAQSPTFSLFSAPPKTESPPKTVSPPPPPPKPVAKATPPSTKSSPTFSLFPPAPKKKDAPVTQNPPEPNVLFGQTSQAPTPASEKSSSDSPLFSFFSGPPKKDSPKPKAAPKKVQVQSSPTLSLFSAPKKPVAKESAPKPAPAPSPAFSFFNPKPKEKAAPQPAPAPAKSTPSFSLFGSPAKSTKEPTKVPQPASAKSTPSFSLFGRPSKATDSPAKATKQPPKIPNRGGTISLFGSNKPAQKPREEKAPAKEKPAFSLFGAAPKKTQVSPATKAPPKDVPVLSRWKQNPDGSITGKVSNSPNFRPNTEITTSPVQKGAKAGSVVKTGSGSRYYLS